MSVVWVDGNYLLESELRVSPFDRGLCHGLSFFETILAVNGKARLLGSHLQRLNQSLHRITQKPSPLSEQILHDHISTLLQKNGLTQQFARIRITVSLGVGPLNLINTDQSWTLITTTPLTDPPDSVRVTTAPWKRDQESIMRGLKTGSYAEHLIALNMARTEGFHELLFYNHHDEICEAAMANVFLIRAGKLYTPPLDSGCLPGITRSFIIHLAKENGIRCVEKPLKRNEINKADCVFLTSSLQGPVRVFSYENCYYHSHPLFETLRTSWMNAMLSGDY